MRDALAFMNTKNSEEVKGGPLSDTSVTGKPCVANIVRNLSMVCEAVVEHTENT